MFSPSPSQRLHAGGRRLHCEDVHVRPDPCESFLVRVDNDDVVMLSREKAR